MSYVFEEMGVDLNGEDRFNLYLTNTLEMQEIEQSHLPGMSTLSEESRIAGKIKKKTPILVILGNPPYSGHSSNVGKWISTEIKEYFKVDGKPLGEKNPKWLQDDYVKFIRFSQWKIDQNGEGMLGFITNHGYLDNPTFRGMRQSLMKSFNEIYFLDLHGNALKKEKCPDGSKDENVFDIRQGVSIALFIKKRNTGNSCKVFHSELWGLRIDKYEHLAENDINSIEWKESTPKSELYLFIPRDEALEENYKKFFKITNIFPVNSVGVVTARDKFVIDMNKENLKIRIEMFLNEKMTDELIEQTFNLKDKSGWRLKKARENLRIKYADTKGHLPENDKSITRILYRPFDEQWIFYHDELIERPRQDVMRHMMHNNISLCFMRQVSLNGFYSHVFISKNIVDNRTFLSSKGIIQQAPLYLYHDPKKKGLFSEHENKMPKNNINSKVYNLICHGLKNQHITHKEIFYYIYAVLYSNIYREKYAEFLRIDFPRIPFASDYDLLIKMGKLGQQLAEIHLMKSSELNQTFSRFEVSGNNIVKKVRYNESEKNVYINDTQYFSKIEKDIWEYQIGGYQVMNKWLKDRKKRNLSLEDIQHYFKIARVLQLTIQYQQKIDELYDEVEKNLIQL